MYEVYIVLSINYMHAFRIFSIIINDISICAGASALSHFAT